MDPKRVRAGGTPRGVATAPLVVAWGTGSEPKEAPVPVPACFPRARKARSPWPAAQREAGDVDVVAKATTGRPPALATPEKGPPMRFRPVELTEDPAIGVEITPAMLITKVASAPAGDAPDADRAGLPA